MTNNNNSILAYINSIYNSLTKSEQKVADSVLEDPNKAIYSSITDFAEVSGVGDTTVLRFCRKLGYRSYQAFKLTLAQQLSNNNNDPASILNVEINDGDTLEEITQKVYNINTLALKETLSLLDMKEVEKAIDLMLSARKIYFYGLDVSSITAQDAVYKFIRVGLEVGTYIESHIQVMQASLLTKEDVVVGISYSGSTKDLLDVLMTAKKAGAKVISITHHASLR